VENTKTAVQAKKFQKKWLSKLKDVSIFLYFFVTPVWQTPDWCAERF
jgi:hypothetical protein